MNPANPIGVFDSGVGGLSVLHEIRRALPGEDLLYVADSGHAPYGDKSRQFIEARSLAITEFLVSRHAKAVVVACNTATGAAVTTLRAKFLMPIIAMEPAVKPAAENTRSGVIGVMATSRTLVSDNFVKLFARYGEDARILGQACPGLVEQVEAGDLSGDKTRLLLEGYVRPLLEQGADTIVLGCTHYPFLAPLIQDIAGPDVTVIDSAAAVARQLRRRLEVVELLADAERIGTECFWTSGVLDKAKPLVAQLWKPDVQLYELPAG
ncbi:glutamate racemase [Candidatus Methylobacter oryzae]|uniref:Glutamate racemase n=1 Tax=Candidatus Methylobacter oryzae TaxID=2497749 RepID=A0ABY3CCA5_9GAMM|nr:glutamate racemase [Candidatus Methylobacter oryzae]TRW98526.1 glutamate racemase [Candidatus Methylobacter oryzae]